MPLRLAKCLVAVTATLALLPHPARAEEGRPEGNPEGAEFLSPPAPHAVRREYLDAWDRTQRQRLSAFPGPVAWSPDGPTPLNVEGDSPVNGRCTVLAVDPANASIVYLGSASGGLWKSTNGGATWIHKTPRGSITGIPADKVFIASIGAIAIDPANHNTIYVGTGEPNFSNDSFYGQGILKSTDAGETWTLLGNSVFAWSAIASIVIDPISPQVLYAASTTGNTTSSSLVRTLVIDPATGILPPLGIYKSTDGGATWTRKLTGRASSLVMDPNNRSHLFAGFRQGTFGGVPTTSGTWESTDSGETWSELNGTRGLPVNALVARTEIAVGDAGVNTNVAIAYESINSRSVLAGLYVSVNGGSSFVSRTPPTTSCQCFYALSLRFDPTNASRLYLGMLDYWRSIDTGTTWTNVSSGWIHVDQHNMAFSPAAAGTLWAVSDGGVYKSADYGTTWSDQNSGGLSVLQFQGIAVPRDSSRFIIGGFQDNGSAVTLPDGSWVETIGGDGGWSWVHGSNPNIVFHNYQYLYGPDRSATKGTTYDSWEYAGNGIDSGERSSFYVPFTGDPSNAERLLLGTYRLYQTQNAGTTTDWTPTTGDLTTGLFEPAGQQDSISAIAVAPSNPQRVYVGSKLSANLRRSDDGGSTFSPLAIPMTAPVTLVGITWIEVSPTDANTVYVATGDIGHPGEHLWRTTDGGSTWTNLDAGHLPPVPVLTVALDPSDSNRIWVGGDAGVYTTMDAGASWQPFNTAMPYVPVFQLRYQAARGALLCATHGRGVWEAQVHTPPGAYWYLE